MQELNLSSSNAQMSFARLGTNHGYRIDGDVAALNADIDIDSEELSSVPGLALQLWACEEPYQGGTLFGFKVAETRVPVPGTQHFQHDAVAFARPPAPARDYAMVLVLAAVRGDSRQVFDFANYPQRQRFIVPHLLGSAGYQITEDGSVALRVAQVTNPREQGNLSGSLTLQLWAVQEPYQGGELGGAQLGGTLLASAELGQLAGQESFEPGELWSALTLPARNTPRVVLALCEWTAQGYLVRDYCNFAEDYAGPWRADESEARAFAREQDKAPEAKVQASVPAEAQKAEPKQTEPKQPLAVEVKAQPAPQSAPVVAVAKPVVAAPEKAVAVEPSKPAESVKAAPAASKSEPVASAPVAAPAASKSEPVASAPVATPAASKSEPVASAPVATPAASKSEPVASAPVAAPAASKSEPPASAKAAPAASKSEPAPADTANGTRPSLNTVSESQLAHLAGLQKKAASDIIKARPFKNFDDLVRVRGIGDKTVQKLRSLFSI